MRTTQRPRSRLSPARAREPGGPGAAVLDRMRWWHIREVGRLERAVFAEDAWSNELFWSELAQGRARLYLVARAPSGRIVGYAGVAVHDSEAYIQTIAVAPGHREGGLGTRLMVAMLRHARERGARDCGLEVRTDNAAARSIYHRFGFADLGIRRGYYQPSGADAYVMAARGLDRPEYGRLLDRLDGATVP